MKYYKLQVFCFINLRNLRGYLNRIEKQKLYKSGLNLCSFELVQSTYFSARAKADGSCNNCFATKKPQYTMQDTSCSENKKRAFFSSLLAQPCFRLDRFFFLCRVKNRHYLQFVGRLESDLRGINLCICPIICSYFSYKQHSSLRRFAKITLVALWMVCEIAAVDSSDVFELGTNYAHCVVVQVTLAHSEKNNRSTLIPVIL